MPSSGRAASRRTSASSAIAAAASRPPSTCSCCTSSATTLLRSTTVPWESGRRIRRCRSRPTDRPEESMTATDITGLGVSTKSADALAAYERGLDLFLRWRGGAVEALDAAATHDPRFALTHCTKAYVSWRMGRADLATAAARKATAVADDARHERERLHLQAVESMGRSDHAGAYDVLGRIAGRYPTDRMAVRVIGLNCITQGDYRGGIDIARRSLAANPDEPQYETMLGFFLEQSGFNDEGLEMSRRSLARDPTSLY